MDAVKTIQQIATAARAAGAQLATTTGDKRDAALRACAAAIRDAKAELQAANEELRNFLRLAVVFK